MQVALIVAAAANGIIGRDNQLPWHLPQDLKYFKATTMGKPVIMGRKTYESIGKPLPGRPNIVVTRNPLLRATEGVKLAGSLEEALAHAEELIADSPDLLPEAMVIGGAEIYRSALPLASRVYLTRVDVQVDGDAFFPVLDEGEWQLASSRDGEKNAALPHRFLVYDRLANK